jgi:hypothetical protein
MGQIVPASLSNKIGVRIMAQKSVTIEQSGQTILGVVIHNGADHHDKAIRHAMIVAGENCEGTAKREIEDAVRRNGYYAEGDWSVNVVGAMEQGGDDADRKAVADRFWQLVEPSIQGYSKRMAQLLDMVPMDALRDYVRRME